MTKKKQTHLSMHFLSQTHTIHLVTTMILRRKSYQITRQYDTNHNAIVQRLATTLQVPDKQDVSIH